MDGTLELRSTVGVGTHVTVILTAGRDAHDARRSTTPRRDR
jgi:hypothetical protein